ncbi:MAG: hypothetical protein U1B30_12525 [Pseudomonadota bacterium]|jgi:hypothetical protein|nr:hypothetical protein [Pseudomonadota bacterium]
MNQHTTTGLGQDNGGREACWYRATDLDELRPIHQLLTYAHRSTSDWLVLYPVL